MAIRRITEVAEGVIGPLARIMRPSVAAGGGGPESNERLLNAFKYRAYLVVLLIGMSSAIFSWWLSRAAHPVVTINGLADPLLAVLCVVLIAVLLWGQERTIRLVERVGYAGIVAYFIADKYYVVYFGDLRSVPIDSVSEVFSWTPVIYILAYLIFGAFWGLAVSGAFYIALLAAGVPHMSRSFTADDASGGFNAFVQFYLANVVIVILLYVFARLIAAYLRTHALNEASQRLAHTDFVTGVPNRRHLYAALEQEVYRSPRDGRPLAVIMFDLDHFKGINDGFGHDAGDRVLRGVAELVHGRLRAPDQLSRWGGEEFLVLAPGTDLEGGEAVALRLREAVEGARFGEIGGVTASFGVAAYRNGDSPETLLKRADEALYAAKHGGRNRVETSV